MPHNCYTTAAVSSQHHVPVQNFTSQDRMRIEEIRPHDENAVQWKMVADLYNTYAVAEGRIERSVKTLRDKFQEIEHDAYAEVDMNMISGGDIARLDITEPDSELPWTMASLPYTASLEQLNVEIRARLLLLGRPRSVFVEVRNEASRLGQTLL
ncbi:hypothetical protein K440DRAFT_657363 [Wilcoxina mikolae CBS 423.85]|nr:hypothetical protein K440DRAFT_657363 [Wilcoxina mikolae CBS 423.85]